MLNSANTNTASPFQYNVELLSFQLEEKKTKSIRGKRKNKTKQNPFLNIKFLQGKRKVKIKQVKRDYPGLAAALRLVLHLQGASLTALCRPQGGTEPPCRGNHWQAARQRKRDLFYPSCRAASFTWLVSASCTPDRDWEWRGYFWQGCPSSMAGGTGGEAQSPLRTSLGLLIEVICYIYALFATTQPFFLYEETFNPWHVLKPSEVWFHRDSGNTEVAFSYWQAHTSRTRRTPLLLSRISDL